jgi:hypothetical protein
VEQTSLEIRIDVLEVEGLGHADTLAFPRDVEVALARLVEQRGMPAVTSRAIGTVPVDPEAGDALSPAEHVAATIYGVLSS